MPAQAPEDVVDGIVARLEPMALGPGWQAGVIRLMLESALETYKDMDRGWVNGDTYFRMHAYRVRDDPAKHWLCGPPFAKDDRLACAWHRVLEVLGPELGGSPPSLALVAFVEVIHEELYGRFLEHERGTLELPPGTS